MKLPNPSHIANSINTSPRRCLGLLILVGVLFMTTWGSFKSGVTFHIDELWQYSFSNSHGRLTNAVERADYNRWLPGSVFRDYITVQHGERFAYGPITQAASRDVHPPLSYYLLHTVASLTPNHFSKWHGLGLNIAIYAATVAMLYLLATLLFVSRCRALAATGLWAFSLGAINTVLYIRMYCLLTLCAVTATYFAVKYLRGGRCRFLFLAYLGFILGGLSDYLFWIFGFFATLGFVAVLMWSNPRRALAFAVSALAAFLTVCALFPATYQQFTRKESLSNWAIENFSVMDRLQQFFHVNAVLRRFADHTGDSSFLLPSSGLMTLCYLGLIAAATGLVVLAVLAVVAAASARLSARAATNPPADAKSNLDFLLANSRAIISDSNRLFLSRIRRLLSRAVQFFRAHPAVLFLVITVGCTGYTLAAVFPDFNVWTLRAFFFLYPFLSLLLAAMLFLLHDKLRVSGIVLLLIVAALLFRTTVFVRSPFTFRDGYAALVSDVRDKDVLIVMDSEDSMMRLTNFSVPLMGAKNVFVMIIENESYRSLLMQALTSAPAQSDVMVLNTIGAPPYNHTAGEIIGWDFLLTQDATLARDARKAGFLLNLEQKHAYLFQTFNLYRATRP